MHQPAVWSGLEVLITGLAVSYASANVAAYLYALKELPEAAVGLLSLL
jgi:hypothetical protein